MTLLSRSSAHFQIIPALAVLLLGLSACSTEDFRNTISERTAIAEQRVDESRQPAPARRYNPLTVTDAVWAGAKAVRMRHGMPLPERVEAPRSVAMISPTPMSLKAIADSIATQTGISVRLSKDVGEVGAGGDEAAMPATATNKKSSTSFSANKKTDAVGAATGRGTGMTLAYEGPLSGLLNQVSSHYGISWKFDGAAISLSKYETRVFVMSALPGTQKVKDGMKESNNEQAAASGSTQITTVSQSAADQSSSFEVDFKFWEEIGKTLEVILTGEGTYALSPSSGTITVVTTPELMQRIAEYINQENDRLSRQVAINVEVYTVDINEGEDFSAKFDVALKRLTNFGFNTTSAGAPGFGDVSTKLGNIAVTVLNPDTVGSINSLFGLLSTVGNTARVAQFPMTTLNNRPVSRRIGRDIAYLASVQNNTSQSFQNTTLTPGVVRDGFSIQITPRIMGDGRIILQYSLSLIDLVGRPRQFSTGEGANASTVELPETSTRVFVQQSMLRSGSTLVLAGFDQDQAQQSSQGVGNAYNYLLGGGVTNTKIRQVLFIAMTPQEISLPRTENE
jgi:type IVB pilus formation R64 PilN family outer membrane protein